MSSLGKSLSIFLKISFIIFPFFVGLALPKTAKAIYSIDPTSGDSTNLTDYARSLSEPGINLQQFTLYNLEFSARGLTKLLIGVPQTGGQASGTLTVPFEYQSNFQDQGTYQIIVGDLTSSTVGLGGLVPFRINNITVSGLTSGHEYRVALINPSDHSEVWAESTGQASNGTLTVPFEYQSNFQDQGTYQIIVGDLTSSTVGLGGLVPFRINNITVSGLTSGHEYRVALINPSDHSEVWAESTGQAAATQSYLAYQNYGLASNLASVTALLYANPPISGINYLAQLGEQTGLVQKPVQAQGFGFKMLNPIQSFWRAMRNIAYIAFVLVFVIAGFMIMFRSRIDPRTVVTISDALPRIIIALILVTFSYAIVGLVIDLTELTLRVIATVFGFASADKSFVKLVQNIEGGTFNIFDLMRSLIKPINDTEWGEFFNNMLSQLPLIGGIIEATDKVGAKISGSIFGLIVSFAIVMAMFRVFIMLLTSLVTVILLTIFSPIQLLLAALPGRGGIISGWMKSILAAVAVFPVTFTMLLMAAIFAGASETWGVSGDVIPNWQWAPAPLGKMMTDQGGVIRHIIALGILLTTPRAAEIVRDALRQQIAPWAGEAGAALGRVARTLSPF